VRVNRSCLASSTSIEDMRRLYEIRIANAPVGVEAVDRLTRLPAVVFLLSDSSTSPAPTCWSMAE
jgi:hypothetical protein